MSRQKKTEEGKAIDLLKQKIPLDDKNIMHEINLKYQRLFKYREPDFKEKKKVCTINKASVIKLGNQFLKDIGLNDKISDEVMYKCIYNNLGLFKYIIVTLEKNQYVTSIVQSVTGETPQLSPASPPSSSKDKNSPIKDKETASNDKDASNKDKNRESQNKDAAKNDKDAPKKDKNKESQDKDAASKTEGALSKDKSTTSKEKLETKKVIKDQSQGEANIFDDLYEDGIFIYDDSDFGYIYYFTP